ncbi:hypothetical protein BV98_001893 [Sphingobium herbicidovorans NBRC 16415]|uniref:Uncharacterized protein n=2 Tax=Sphingobium herbicidovorans TaxID=76947 RepID=A0A086PBC0_SPHHM|nr:hypothetical protein BV98_001893 [Sphingobium herbicidovorans NBRC 16415]
MTSAASSTWTKPIADLTPSERMAERDRAVWMALDGYAKSPQARALAASILKEHEETLAPQGMQRRDERIDNIQTALGATLCDLIGAASQRRWSWRSMRRQAYSRQAVSYRTFALVREVLLSAGLIEELSHFIDESGFGPVGMATRLRLTQAGMALVERHRINLSDHGAHFGSDADRKALLAAAIDL